MTEAISPRTVIEGFLQPEHPTALDVVFDAANHAGIPDQPIRLALRRMIAAGDIEQVGRGRSGKITLTPSGKSRLLRDRIALQFAFDQDNHTTTWDGTWKLLALSAPENKRSIRDALRREIVMIGGAPISTGLYVSPHNLSDLFPDSVQPYLVTATAQDLNIRGLTDPHAIAEELWPAQHVIDLYHVLTDALEADNPAEQPFVRQLKLADALERVLRIDPLIPLELRTQPWPPSEIRKQWIRTWHTTLTGAEDTHVFAGWITEN